MTLHYVLAALGVVLCVAGVLTHGWTRVVMLALAVTVSATNIFMLLGRA